MPAVKSHQHSQNICSPKALLLIDNNYCSAHPDELINIHVFDCPDSRLPGLFTKVPTSPDNQGSTVLSNENKLLQNTCK